MSQKNVLSSYTCGYIIKAQAFGWGHSVKITNTISVHMYRFNFYLLIKKKYKLSAVKLTKIPVILSGKLIL